MDVARAFHRALNDADLDAMVALYHPDCVVEHVWIDGRDVVEGRDRVRVRWADELARYDGALAGGHRLDVTRIAGIETGWGWVRSRVGARGAPAGGGAARAAVGYSHFWIEDGLIRRHRDDRRRRWTRSGSPSRGRRPSAGTRRGRSSASAASSCPTTADVLLVKRRQEPLAGQWSLPGGMLEIGETLEAGMAREMLEETGLVVIRRSGRRSLRPHPARRHGPGPLSLRARSTICAACAAARCGWLGRRGRGVRRSCRRWRPATG